MLPEDNPQGFGCWSGLQFLQGLLAVAVFSLTNARQRVCLAADENDLIRSLPTVLGGERCAGPLEFGGTAVLFANVTLSSL